MKQNKDLSLFARTAGMLTSARRVAMLLVTLLLTMTAHTAWAEVTYQWDGDTKTLTFSGSGEITYDMVYNSGYREYVKTVVIGSGVTSIFNAFNNCTNLATVTFEPGSQLTSIGDNAFANCSNLTSIAIPNSVTTIGFGAFTECDGLKSFIIPASVTSIETLAFFRCNLEIVVVQRYTSGESPITSLVGNPFDGCDALKMICVPNDALDAYKNDAKWSQYYSTDMSINKIQAINNYCGDPEVNDGKNVYYAYYLQPGTSDATLAIAGSGAMNNYSAQPWLGFDVKTVNIGYGVTSISQYAFYNRNSLTSVPIPSSVTSISNNAFEGCTGLTSITIPASVESIGEQAFDKCTGLTSVSIPNSVTSIYGNTFNGCEKLESINVDVNNQNYASEDGVLFNKDKTTLVRYPIGKSGTSYDIPASVTSIEDNAFNGCSGLTSITIPASVTTIGDGAFRDCTALTSVTIFAPSLTNYDAYTFVGNPADRKIFVPSGSVDSYKTGWNDYATAIEPLDYIIDEDKDVSILSNGTGKNVALKRAFPKGKKQTVCLPFAPGELLKYGKVWEFTGISDDNKAVMTQRESGLQANTPYIFEATNDLLNITFPSVGISIGSDPKTVNGTDNFIFQGTYSRIDWAADALPAGLYGFVAKDDNYSQGEFVKAYKETFIRPFRAYLLYTGSGDLNGTETATARRMSAEELPDVIDIVWMPADALAPGEATGIRTTSGPSLNGEEWYDLQGRKLQGKPTKKGMYINNGRKMIIK